MAARDETSWRNPPKVPATHYVSGRVYHDESVYEDERAKLFGKVWVLVCHESEVAQKFDFRTTELAGTPLVAFGYPRRRRGCSPRFGGFSGCRGG